MKNKNLSVSHTAQTKSKKPRKMTEERLEKVALFYLERFASSTENLRRVLLRRLERSLKVHEGDRDSGVEAIERILQRFIKAGLLDDQAYAHGRTASLHRRGASLRAIRMKLTLKGLAPEHIEKAIQGLSDDIRGDLSDKGQDEDTDPDLIAAMKYARRRRLGPFRKKDRDSHRERDMAALGRQGFSYDVARSVIDTKEEFII